MRWDKELPQCIRKLRNQHVHYAQTIRILLEPMSSAEELAEMMMHPGESQLWKDKDMASRLQNRLQVSYHAYQGTIADIERITKQIASKLDLDRANEVRRPEPTRNIEGDLISCRASVGNGTCCPSIQAISINALIILALYSHSDS